MEICQNAVWAFLVRQDDKSNNLLKFYSLFVFLGLAFEAQLKPTKDPDNPGAYKFASEEQQMVAYIYFYSDLVMTTIMFIEILMKIFAKGRAFFEPFEIFDTLIIVGAFIALLASGPDDPGVAGLGLLRLMRLVKVIIRSQPKRKQIEKPKDGKDEFTVGSNVDRVLDLCDKLLNHQGISDFGYSNMVWAQECISKNELYTLSVDAGDVGGAGDVDMAAWVQDLNIGADIHVETNTKSKYDKVLQRT